MSDEPLDARVARLELDLERQRLLARDRESLIEDRTRRLFAALEEGERQRSRIACHEAATRLLGESDEIVDVAEQLLQVFCEELGWPVGAIWLPDPSEAVLRGAAIWHASTFFATEFAAACRRVSFARGEGLPGQVWESGRPEWIDDLASDPSSGRVRAAEEDGIRTACGFPILASGQVVAVVELAAADMRERSDQLLDHVSRLGVHAGGAIERRRARRAVHDLALARRIQTSVLPRRIEVPGFEISARMRTTEDVGGDYYDVLACPGGFWVGIGDVSGHGLDAGLIMLMLQSAISALVRGMPEAQPGELLASVNAVLCDNIRQRLVREDFVTCSLIRVWDDGRLAMSGAHEDVLLLRARAGACEVLSPPGTWLGLRTRFKADDLVARVERGDLIVLHTDGITEAMNGDRQLFGIERLRAAVEAARHEPAERIVDSVFAAVDRWQQRQRDDMCLVAIRYTG